MRQDRDILIIEKPAGRLKKYDVPLYKRDNGQYVLHRVLKVRKNDYVICGDIKSTYGCGAACFRSARSSSKQRDSRWLKKRRP